MREGHEVLNITLTPSQSLNAAANQLDTSSSLQRTASDLEYAIVPPEVMYNVP